MDEHIIYRGVPRPTVAVTAIQATGGVAHTVMSDGQGTYVLANLPAGTYRIDFYFPHFEIIRRNNVQVRVGETVHVDDVTLPESPVCECLNPRDEWARLKIPDPLFVERSGQVVDAFGQPLPHARLEIESPIGLDTTYADREGRFRVFLLPDQAWPLTARDSGFGAATERVSGSSSAPVLLRLPNGDTKALPDTEQFTLRCCLRVLGVPRR